MSHPDERSREHFDALREHGKTQFSEGRLEDALATYDEARRWAERHGGRDDVDLAELDRASILIDLGRGAEVLDWLRRILMRSTDPVNRFLAAYGASRLYDERQDGSRTRFYARLALECAEQAGSDEFRAHGHNRIANIELAESYFDAACSHYEKALRLLPEEDRLDRALVLGNLGYGEVVRGLRRQGMRHLFAGLRMLRRLGAKPWETHSRIRLGLAYGYLELERFERATRHARATLRAAEELGDGDALKKALYLLGEAEKQAGRAPLAYAYFARLQEEFHPENARLPALLMASETAKLINLMA